MFVSIMTSCFPLGGVLGVILSGWFGGNFGRRATLIIFSSVQTLT